jgi:hypothetical protein
METVIERASTERRGKGYVATTASDARTFPSATIRRLADGWRARST